VLKPAELTPLTALALAELADRAGVPDGVFNVVLGDAPAIGAGVWEGRGGRGGATLRGGGAAMGVGPQWAEPVQAHSALTKGSCPKLIIAFAAVSGRQCSAVVPTPRCFCCCGDPAAAAAVMTVRSRDDDE